MAQLLFTARFATLAALLVIVMGCQSDPFDISAREGTTPHDKLEQISYTLEPAPNSGPLSEGVAATATLYELATEETLVHLQLDEGSTEVELAHPAHIHYHSVEQGPDIGMGQIFHFLGPVDGAPEAPGESYMLIDSPLDSLVNLDAHIKIHESNNDLHNILALGNIGANSDAESERGEMESLAEGRTQSYLLDAVANEGSVPDGAEATLQFRELTSNSTLLSVELHDGTTATTRSHPVHLREGGVSDNGDIAQFLGAVDGNFQAPGKSYSVIEQPYDELISFDGHVQIVESNARPENILAQGDIGANAN